MIENMLFIYENTTNFSIEHRIELFSHSVQCNEFQTHAFLVTKTTDLKYLSGAGVPFVSVINFYTRIIILLMDRIYDIKYDKIFNL